MTGYGMDNMLSRVQRKAKGSRSKAQGSFLLDLTVQMCVPQR